MTDLIKEATGAIKDKEGKDNKINNILRFSVVIIILFFILTAWGNVEQRILSSEIARSSKNVEWLVANAGDVRVIKAGILRSVNDTSEYWKQELLPTIGKLLAANGIEFPQELNLVIQRYVTKYDEIKDELIFP